ncbi:MAG TPA: PQQ-binding-like beta-propeller repeat protein [Actinomycetota bacterium]|nr:PQQ-binding-like beta-propeller repeat protein [Actinomycetota bacterium]
MSLIFPASGAGASATCAAEASGGEWSAYGGSARGMRWQPEETKIGAASVGSLTPAWSFDVLSVTDDYGRFENTPVIADGCLYLATTNAYIVALNADTAEVVWATRLPYERAEGYGGAIVGSVTVAHGRVFATVSDSAGPYLASLDQEDGTVEFKTIVDDRPLSFVTASPIVYEDLVFVGISGQEAADGSRGGYALVHAIDGEVLAKEYTISDEEFAAGYEGASIWATPVIDERTGYAFAGTGNPSSSYESRMANAILKIDVDQSRDTFGQIVGGYKGNWDAYTPNCNSSDTMTGCVNIDVDFGASLNLFEDRFGRTFVGAMQKSGVYYAIYADTMQEAWTAIIGTPGHAFNAASTAVDKNGVYVPATTPGQMVSLDRSYGSLRWAAPMADGVHYQPASVANGVVYTTTMNGAFLAYAAADGRPLLARPLAIDTGAFDPAAPAGSGDIGGVLAVAATSAGIAIARNTVYVAFQTFIVAYRLPA